MCTAELLYLGRSTARTEAITADRLHPTIADTMTNATSVRIHTTCTVMAPEALDRPVFALDREGISGSLTIKRRS